MDIDNRHQTLSKQSVKRIGHEVNDRITDDAVLRVIAEEEVRMEKIFRAAQVMARHAGRQTIKEDDVRQVYKFIDGFDE